MKSLKAVLAALNVEHGAAGEGLTEVEKKASLEVIIVLFYRLISHLRMMDTGKLSKV